MSFPPGPFKTIDKKNETYEIVTQPAQKLTKFCNYIREQTGSSRVIAAHYFIKSGILTPGCVYTGCLIPYSFLFVSAENPISILPWRLFTKTKPRKRQVSIKN